jgi:RNA polymerase sigma-70 factor (ECF subfamily)
VADELMDFGVELAEEADGGSQVDEARLSDGLRQGAEWAYEDLIERFQQPVFNLVSRVLWDPNDVCDVVQEVFLKVFRKIGSFRGDSSLKTWVYRIAVNEAHNHCRWSGRHRGHEVGLEGDEEARSYRDILPSPGCSPYDFVLDRERHRMVEAALA